MARRHSMRALLCALLAAGVAPSTLRAAYAEVQAVQVAAARDAQPAPIPRIDRSSRRTSNPHVSTFVAPALPVTAPLYVLYCSLLR